MINDHLKQKIVESISQTDITLGLLFLKFGDAVVKLQDCLDYTSFKTIGEANRAASEGRLPFAAFRICDSQKGERYVSIHDLAKHIDAKHAEAKRFRKLISGKENKKSEIAADLPNRRRKKSHIMLA